MDEQHTVESLPPRFTIDDAAPPVVEVRNRNTSGLRPFRKGDPRASEMGRKGGRSGGDIMKFRWLMKRTARSLMMEPAALNSVEDAKRLLAMAAVATLHGSVRPIIANTLVNVVETWLKCDAAVREHVELAALRQRLDDLEARPSGRVLP